MGFAERYETMTNDNPNTSSRNRGTDFQQALEQLNSQINHQQRIVESMSSQLDELRKQIETATQSARKCMGKS